MKNFDYLKIQKEIEEKRLILGEKFEKFLLCKLLLAQGFLQRILSHQNFAFFGSLIIIALSLFIQSSRDIGHDSAVYIEIATKMLNGGKYYQDFFELNFPLNFWLLLPVISLAKFLNINAIFLAQIFVNLLGIIAIFFSAKILSRSELKKDQVAFNIVILSFSAAFFLRVFTLHFNEFITKSTFFISLALPYFSYQFLQKREKIDEIFCGILAALIICLKINYAALILVFELRTCFESLLRWLENVGFAVLRCAHTLKVCLRCDARKSNIFSSSQRDSKRVPKNLYEKEYLKKSFYLRNLITFVFLLLYLVAIFLFQKDYFLHISEITQSYLTLLNSGVKTIIKDDIYPFILFFSLSFFLLKENPLLQKFYLFSLAGFIIVISEILGGYDQRFIIYSLSLPAILLSLLFLLRSDYFDFKKQAIFLIFIFIIPQFDAKSFFNLALNICCFWFVFILVFRLKNLEIKSTIFYPKTLLSWLQFAALSIISIALFLNPKTAFLAWIFSAILLIFFLNFYQKNFSKNKFSLPSSAIITLILSYIFSLYSSAIFNLNSLDKTAYNFKSPNFTNEQIIKIIEDHGKEGEVATISFTIPTGYPAILYAKKQNPLPSLQILFLHKNNQKQNFLKAKEYLLSRLKQQLLKKENKLIFIENFISINQTKCEISFLEYYLRDAEFKKIFLKNYRFLNRIKSFENKEQTPNFYQENLPEELKKNSMKMISDIEIYVRK